MSELLLARLPVYAPDLSVFAYLLRTDLPGVASEADYEEQHAHLLFSALTRSDVTEVEAGKPLFIALSRPLLNEENLRLLDCERFKLAVPFSELDDACIEHLIALSQSGFEIAVSDYRYAPENRRVLLGCRYLFMDAATEDAAIKKAQSEAKRFDVRVIATGIADHETLKRMRALKVDGYMGEFLTKPDLFNPVKVSSNRLIVYRLLEALQDPNVNLTVIENLLAQDNRLSYKLLKVLSSPHYAGAGRDIHSVRDIIMLMGLDQLKTWATLIALTNIEDKPYELMVTTMLRAKMAERIAESMGVETPAMAFMTGLLSTLDALLDRTMDDVLGELPVATQVKDALLTQNGPIGAILADILNYERAQWDALGGKLLSRDDYRRIYTESVIWASKLCSTLSG